MLWTWRSTDGLYQPASAARAHEWFRKAQECEAQHRTPSAIKAYEHASRSPDRGMAAIANYPLGRLYEQRHHCARAIVAYRRAVRSGTGEDSSRAGAALVRLGG